MNSDGRPDRVLWYDEPAQEWIDALPVGNGRLGAMVHGGLERERIQCNEESVWAGGHVDRTNPDAADHLADARRRCFEGEYEAAQRICNEHLLGDPPSLRPYRPFCDLLIEQSGHDDPTAYRRELDLADGIARVEYAVDGREFTREYFASAPDDVLVVRLECEDGEIDASFRLAREQGARAGTVDDRLVLRGQVIDLPHDEDPDLPDTVGLDSGPGGWGVRFEGRALVRPEGGSVERTEAVDGDPPGLAVSGADAVTVLLAGATDFDETDPTEACRRTLEAAADRPYADLRERHVADHREYFDRLRLDLDGPTALDDPAAVPTDERLDAVRAGGQDPGLVALYVQYGRYLLLASSRPGTLPANLQGIWNEEYAPPWDSGYTLDVNLEMNYWHAEVTNLAECAEPLVSFVDSLRASGRETAREHYDCEGFVAHIATDVWRTTVSTVDAHWGFWPMAPAWLCQNLWEHYAFSGDEDDLEAIYPVLKEAAAFLLDYLVEHPEYGWLVTAPSSSPENQFRTPDGREATVCEAPTMDVQLITDLFTHCIEAADELGVDDGVAADLADALERLPPMQVGADGRLQEWLEDFEEVDPGHRHVSHLVGFYPADVITLRDDPDLAEAVRATLERRLEHGGGHTGWSRAWIVSLFARLEDGDRAHENLHALLAESTYDNLFDSHPPFQIDGNFGGAAGVAEMLLGSHADEVRLLPALPDAWPEGSVDGLRARGGLEVAVSWSEGRLESATIRADHDDEVRVRTYNSTVERVETAAGDAVALERPAEGVVAFPTEADREYRLVAGSR